MVSSWIGYSALAAGALGTGTILYRRLSPGKVNPTNSIKQTGTTSKTEGGDRVYFSGKSKKLEIPSTLQDVPHTISGVSPLPYLYRDR